MINDQIMFIAEHVHGFTSGHEGMYETGRALGKYIERAFLAMKIAGLDIKAVRERPKHDPQRRLLEAVQSLMKVKNEPDKLVEQLKEFSRTSPKSEVSGMEEIFWLIEKVLPGMEGMTGVLADKPLVKARSPAETRRLDGAYRRMRMVVLQRWRSELTLVRETLGPDAAVDLINAELSKAEAQLRWIEQRMKELAKIGKEYLAKDWKKATLLKHAIYEYRVQEANLPDPKPPLLGEINKAKKRVETKLASLRRTQPDEADLYENSAPYRHLANRKEYLRDRLRYLRDGLDEEKKGAKKARKLMALDLSGSWACKADNMSNIAATVTAVGDRLTMELKLAGKTSGTAKVEAQRHWGTIKGFWNLPVDGAATGAAGGAASDVDVKAAGIIDAAPTGDGKEIQFTKESTSDLTVLALDWSSLVCRRDQAGGTAPPAKEFVTISYMPMPGDPDLNQKWGVEVVNPSGVDLSPPAVRVRKGRKSYGKTRIEPGQYLAAIELGGRIVTRPIMIKPRTRTMIALRPAAVRVNGVPDGDRRGVKVRLHPAGEREVVLIEFNPARWAGVPPGRYDLEFATSHGSAWVKGIELKAGQALDVKTSTGALVAAIAPGLSNVRFRRATVEGARGDFWISLMGKGRAGPLPPGKYDIAWDDDGKARSRRITVKPGEENRIDLR
ncbi:MAG: hypothetical protein O7E53_01700, partial [Alphaproteobacteria bacterium]|nr:hypothetical protein [Alphaproteobacteria bacterium]